MGKQAPPGDNGRVAKRIPLVLSVSLFACLPSCIVYETLPAPATNGAEIWCTRHAEHHVHGHRFAYINDRITSAESAAYGTPGT